MERIKQCAIFITFNTNLTQTDIMCYYVYWFAKHLKTKTIDVINYIKAMGEDPEAREQIRFARQSIANETLLQDTENQTYLYIRDPQNPKEYDPNRIVSAYDIETEIPLDKVTLLKELWETTAIQNNEENDMYTTDFHIAHRYGNVWRVHEHLQQKA